MKRSQNRGLVAASLGRGAFSRRLANTAAILATVVFVTSNNLALAGTHSSSGSAPPPPSSGGSSGGAVHSAGPVGGGPHFYISPRYYSGLSNYHPTITNYGPGLRRFSYPPIHGTMVPINPHRVTPNQYGTAPHIQSQPGLTSRNHPVNPAQAQTNAQIGKWSHSNITGRSKLDPQTATQLRHWNGKVDSAAQARQNNSQFRHEHHDRDWWRHHCAAILFFDFGWWGWWDGWWYPAWGYDPYFDYYAYDQPIYGYDGLPPDQVVANVQSALQQLGYYSYSVDGTIGPLTRAAIADYQRDHLLPITGDIDPATLGSLGLTY